MRVIALRAVREFWSRHADSEQPLRAWFHDASKATWRSPHDIKNVYRNASIINDERVVFNIKGNEYRIIVSINYKHQIVFIKFVGTHTEYDRVDAATVEI
jgi:mRNA interferase HigB